MNGNPLNNYHFVKFDQAQKFVDVRFCNNKPQLKKASKGDILSMQ